MQEIVNFLRDYWQYISIGLVILFDILILILKRRLKINYELPTSWYSDIVKLISEAEKIYGSGQGKQKLNYVIEKMKSKLGFKYFDGVFNMMVETFVENILNTPTKKGGLGREEKKDA